MDTDEQDKEIILRQKSCWSSQISNVGPVNVAHKENRKVTSVNLNMKGEHVSLPKTQ